MRILFLAPQPFFQERGTPIAVRLALKVLAGTEAHEIELLTFPEGNDVCLPNVRISRIWAPGWLYGVRPGFSLKKLLCDLIFFFYALLKVLRARCCNRSFALIHAVEESVFMALCFRFLCGTPYIYDMDSSLSLQLTEKLPWLCPLRPVFDKLEEWAIRYSLAVIPVCDALAVIAQDISTAPVEVLPDISLSSEEGQSPQGLQINLRNEIGLAAESKIILYVGNLEHYQGVELLIDSFDRIKERAEDWYLVIIGGSPAHLNEYRQKIFNSGLSSKVYLTGTRPVSNLDYYLKQADILASPRTLGNNTPMKIYSYMHSGIPIIATKLSTHTQVLTSEMAMLAEADTASFAAGLTELINNADLRAQIAHKAFEEAEAKYTFKQFSQKLQNIYRKAVERMS